MVVPVGASCSPGAVGHGHGRNVDTELDCGGDGDGVSDVVEPGEDIEVEPFEPFENLLQPFNAYLAQSSTHPIASELWEDAGTEGVDSIEAGTLARPLSTKIGPIQSTVIDPGETADAANDAESGSGKKNYFRSQQQFVKDPTPAELRNSFAGISLAAGNAFASESEFWCAVRDISSCQGRSYYHRKDGNTRRA